MILRVSSFLIAAALLSAPALGQEQLAVVNVTVIDGTDHLPRENATVYVQERKIISVSGKINKFPERTTVIDGTGKYMIPGLWNNDLHGPTYDTAKPVLADLLSYGITTVRDMGAPLADIVRLRDATASGALLGPRLFIAGPLLEGPVPIQMNLIVDLFSATQAQEEVRALKQEKVDYIEVGRVIRSTLNALIRYTPLFAPEPTRSTR